VYRDRPQFVGMSQSEECVMHLAKMKKTVKPEAQTTIHLPTTPDLHKINLILSRYQTQNTDRRNSSAKHQ